MVATVSEPAIQAGVSAEVPASHNSPAPNTDGAYNKPIELASGLSCVVPSPPLKGQDTGYGLVPSILRQERFAGHLNQFLAEYDPEGPTETALVRDLARHATAMERCGDATESVERHAARNLPELAKLLPADDLAFSDAVLSGAMATSIAQKCEQLGLARSRAFLKTLRKLEDLQARRKVLVTDVTSLPPSPFPTESACESYLVKRLQRVGRRCDVCGGPSGCFLPSRRVWECGQCGKQQGMRHGTLMAGSALPLSVWFEAIRLSLGSPNIGKAQLAERIGVRRITTVRNMARRIREAFGSEDASELLAGLDHYFAHDPNHLKQVRVGEQNSSFSEANPAERQRES